MPFTRCKQIHTSQHRFLFTCRPDHLSDEDRQLLAAMESILPKLGVIRCFRLPQRTRDKQRRPRTIASAMKPELLYQKRRWETAHLGAKHSHNERADPNQSAVADVAA